MSAAEKAGESAGNSLGKRAASSQSAKKVATKQSTLKDPSGGLTAAGRKAFAEKDGSHLRPGVQGPADMPDKMKRKGSFLTRHFTHPRGPMIKDGKPTRLALSAHAWGEAIPKTLAAATKLAAKGRKLLKEYHKIKEAAEATKPAAAKRSLGATKARKAAGSAQE